MRPVFWSEEARQDYFEILHYIASDNPFAAERIVDAIEEAGNELSQFATGRPGRVAGTYEKLVIGLPYIVAYSITSKGGREVISILRVIHMARDWPAGEWPE
ncbi:type II toxin-antitoxin system RelE/ParE family toxin [Mesorhizobium sp. WSM2239]|uniref:Type II toxin-antitoxin system RelE/ParE family toxin n=2 Tax=unclassified Mesorhizobium TaxID=325217 RepID=A0AAU8D363_9HYPH